MHPHALLVLAGAILLSGAGIVLLGLAWRRRVRGEGTRGAATPEPAMSRARTLAPIILVPVIGLLGSLAAALVVAVLQGRLRLP